jgi:prenyltransferase beta subunit
MEEKEIIKELENYTGSENFYKDFLGFVLTDGVKKLCDLCNCYWIISDTAVILMDKYKNKEDFIVIDIKVNKDKSCKISLSDGNKNVLYTQEYKYTDFSLSKYTIWAVFNEVDTYTYMLPREY